MSEAKLPIYQLGRPATAVVPTITAGYNIPGNAINSRRQIPASNVYSATNANTSVPKQSYLQRTGQTRFDTIMNASGQVVNTLTGIVGLINEFKGGRTVYIHDSSTGEQRKATSEDIAFMESQALAAQNAGTNQIDMATLFAMMNQQQKPKDNTALYIGLGVGGLLLIGVIVMAVKK